LITFRPSDDQIGQNEYDLQWLVQNQVLSLKGDLEFISHVWGKESDFPLEFWAVVKENVNVETGTLVSDSKTRSIQEDLEKKRTQWLKDNRLIQGMPIAKHPKAGEVVEIEYSNGTVKNRYVRDQYGNETEVLATYPEYERSKNSKDTLPFKLTVNPRLQVSFIISLDKRRGYSGLLEAEYARGDYTRWGYDTFENFQGSYWIGENTLSLSLVEGDSIEWDGSYFTVKHYEQIIFKDNYCTSLNTITSIGAYSLGQTEEQAQQQGRLDDPLTLDVDETINLSGDDDPTTFRPTDFNKRRLEAIRKARYRNGSQTIGSAFLAGLAYMALTFIRRG